jgi:hypothetical protein
LEGRYETVTDVTDYLNLALDAADMKESTDLATKLNIYQNGRSGGSSSITLQSLSLTAETEMAENPLYYFFKHAFLVLGNAAEHETKGMFDGAPIEQYADTIVNDLFELNKDDIETEAALVMNVWMACVNQLFQVLVECRAQDKESGMAHLDKAAALWIGAEQVEGSKDRGHLLYSLAENAGERFGQDNGETWVNTQVIGSLVEIQNALLGDQCSTGDGYQQLRKIIKTLVGYMTVPLVQNLIHHTMNVENEGKSDMVELYALGIIPRVAACSPEFYDEELNLDVLRDLTVAQQAAAIESIQKAYSCLQVTCADVGSYLGGVVPVCSPGDAITRANYVATAADSRDVAYMDRDILQMDIFLKFEAYGVALDWYSHGWSSDLYSIRNFAKNGVVPEVANSHYTLFSNYYEDAEFAHNRITSILELIPPYNSASKEQTRNAAIGFIKYVVFFLASADSFKYAVNSCTNGDTQTSLKHIDYGTLLLVGSMEGSGSSGNSFGGEFLFTAAKELCSDFDTCITSSGTGVATAAVNEKMMMSINDLAPLISAQSCDEAREMVENTILPAMMIPLIQGTLKYASYNSGLEAGTMDASLSIGDAFSRAVIPLVDQVSPEDANTIKMQMEFQTTASPVSEGFDSVADAFRQNVEPMNVKCEEVGTLVDEPIASNLCGDGVSAPRPSQGGGGDQPAPTPPPVTEPVTPGTPESLAFGRYTFVDPAIADGDGSFALDIRDMFLSSSTTEASEIYTNGKNAMTTGLSGEVGLVSLSSLSSEASTYMADDPMFNIFKYALYDDADLDGTQTSNFLFANDIVVEALTNGNDSKLAAEASVVLNVWLLITHRLYSAVQECEDDGTPETLVDSAVALWIGKDQSEGLFDEGWMLYSIGQSSAKFFGHPEGEATVNSKLMNLFVEAQTISKSCLSSRNASTVLRSIVHEIIRTMTKPLIMSLLFHMIKNSKNMVELYAVAVVPQAAACSSETYSVLENSLYSGYSQESSITDVVLDHLATFLRCQRITCEDIKTGENAEDSLVDLSQSLCSRLNDGTFSELSVAGYEPQTSVSEMARIDLDALEMYIMMRTGAFDAARDIYEYGHHSVAATDFGAEDEATDLLTLRMLATSTTRENAPQLKLYQNYFGSDAYADDIINKAVTRSGNYVTASRRQRAEVVRRTLQTMVTYMAAITKMQSAIDNCKGGFTDKARGDWDRAVALYVGSIEGILAGGLQHSHGELMYALGNEVCDDFGACEASGEAKVNQQLMFDFVKGRDSLVDGVCDHIERAVTDDILPKMAIPLIQGTISFVIQFENSQNANLLADVHILSQALAPLIQQDFGTFSSISSPGASVVVSALKNVIPDMGIDCDDVIGSPNGFDLCDGGGGGADSPSKEKPTSLANNLYVTTTYVQDRANIALDIKDISEALRDGNTQLAKLVYSDGKNSQVFDEDGKFVKLRSLKSFSTERTNDMLDEPEFNLFMYALNNDRLYADNLVEESLNNSFQSNPEIPVEATLVLNLWMEIVHLLHETLQACKNKQLRDEDGVHSMDIAVAYWIGDGQLAGDATNGHLLYALAEKHGEMFNVDDGGQSRANSNILKLFNEAKNEVSLPNACSESRTTYVRLRRITNDIISQMAVPLIQGLISSLRSNDRQRVKIYSHAFVPLVAGCSPSLFEALREKLLPVNYNVVDAESIINLIRKSYPCLGLTCSDIGKHEAEATDEAPECDDPDVFARLAGYRPASDVREYARLDLDIREMDVLLQMKAFAAAEDLYSYGKHVGGANGVSLSLAQLATTSQRSNVPSYEGFVRYYSTETWADAIIRQALDPAQSEWTDEQAKIVAIKSSQVLITYFGAMQNAYDAVTSCSTTQQARQQGDTEYWDRAAATIIGHLEGSKANGTVEGYMLYDLSQQHCREFGTCKDDVTGVDVNEAIISLLYTGRGAALESSCHALRKAADELSSILLIPIIQGALSASMALSNGEDKLRRAEAYVYSRALLPFLRDRGAVNALETFLGNQAPKNSRQTAGEVYGALATAYPDMGVDCAEIGSPSGFDPCSGVQYGVSSNVWIIVGVLGGLLCCSCSIFLYMRSKRRDKLPENNPQFVPSDTGELNHSMDLLEKAFSTREQRTILSAETEALNADEDEKEFESDEDDEDGDFDDMASLKENGDVPDII